MAPENTLEGLGRALGLGVDMVELDVRATADGVLVLAHSDALAEASPRDRHASICRLSRTELSRVAPSVPTLDEALSFLHEKAPELALQVDLKLAAIEPALVASLRRVGAVERTLVSSHFSSSLRTLRRLEPRLGLGLSYPHDRHGLSGRPPLAPVGRLALAFLRRSLPITIGPRLASAGASAAMLNVRVLSPAVVSRCHELGAAVFAWTIDDPEVAESVVRWGVDGVITNDPRIFRGAIFQA